MAFLSFPLTPIHKKIPTLNKKAGTFVIYSLNQGTPPHNQTSRHPTPFHSRK